jgi:hypothetical protein
MARTLPSRAQAHEKGGHPVKHTFQNSLLDTGAMFGEPVTAEEARKISGQRALVEDIMRDGFWRTLPSLRNELKRRFGVLYAETSISARLRGLRAAGYTVTSRRTRPGSGLYEYRAVKCARPALASILNPETEKLAAATASSCADFVEEWSR